MPAEMARVEAKSARKTAHVTPEFSNAQSLVRQRKRKASQRMRPRLAKGLLLGNSKVFVVAAVGKSRVAAQNKAVAG